MSDKSLRALGEALHGDMRAFLHALGTGWLEHEDSIDRDWLTLDALATELAHIFQPGDEWVALDTWLTSGFMPMDLFGASEAQSTAYTAQAAQPPQRAALQPGATPVTPELGHGPQHSLVGKEMAPPPLAQRQPWQPQAGVTFWPIEAGRAQPPMAPPPPSPWSEGGVPRSGPGQQEPAVTALPARHAEPDAPAPVLQSAPPSQLPEQPVPPWPRQAMRVSPTDTAEHEEHQASGPLGGEERQRRPGVGRAQEKANRQAVDAPGQPAAVLVPRADEAATMPSALQRTTPGPVQGLRALAAWLDSTPAEAGPVTPAPSLPGRTPADPSGPLQRPAVVSPQRAHGPLTPRDRAEGGPDARRSLPYPPPLPAATGDAVPSVVVPGEALRLGPEEAATSLEPGGEGPQQPLRRRQAGEGTGRREIDVPGHAAAGEPPRGIAAATGGGRDSRRMLPAPVASAAAVLTPSTRGEATAPPAPPHAVSQAVQGRQVLATSLDAAPTAAVFAPAVPGTTLPVPIREDMPGPGQHPSVAIPQHPPRPLHPLPSHALPVREGERVPYPLGSLETELPAASQGYEASPGPDGAASQRSQGAIQAEDTAPPIPVRTTPQPVQGLQALAALLNAASAAPATPASQNQSLSHQHPAVGSHPTRPQDAPPSVALPLTAARVDAASVAWERPVTADDAGRSQVVAGSDRATAAQPASPTTRGATPQTQGHDTRPRVEAWHSQRRELLSTPRPDHPRRGLQPWPGQARQRQTAAEDLFLADMSPVDGSPAAAPPADGAASADTPHTRSSEGYPPSQQPGHEPAPGARVLQTDSSSALAARVVHWTEDIDLDGILEALAREIQQEYRRFYGD